MCDLLSAIHICACTTTVPRASRADRATPPSQPWSAPEARPIPRSGFGSYDRRSNGIQMVQGWKTRVRPRRTSPHSRTFVSCKYGGPALHRGNVQKQIRPIRVVVPIMSVVGMRQQKTAHEIADRVWAGDMGPEDPKALARSLDHRQSTIETFAIGDPAAARPVRSDRMHLVERGQCVVRSQMSAMSPSMAQTGSSAINFGARASRSDSFRFGSATCRDSRSGIKPTLRADPRRRK